MTLGLVKARRALSVLSGMLLTLVIVTSVGAVEAGDYDWASDITDNIAGFTAGVVASIAAVFAIAIMVRLTFKAARLTLKSLGFIK